MLVDNSTDSAECSVVRTVVWREQDEEWVAGQRSQRPPVTLCLQSVGTETVCAPIFLIFRQQLERLPPATDSECSTIPFYSLIKVVFFNQRYENIDMQPS